MIERVRPAVALAVSLVMVGASGSPAWADPDQTSSGQPGVDGSKAQALSVGQLSPVERELMRVQGRLDAAAGRIEALVARDRLAGYAGLVVSAATRELTLYWHGTPPPALQGLTVSPRTAVTRSCVWPEEARSHTLLES